jgi:DNA mismatch endonuclease (patch repair protein)
MADVVDPATRSRMMAGIRGKDTKPELLLRKALHARGFRYRLGGAKLPGRPDLVLPRHSAVVFVHGCFWHGHGCRYFKWPKTRTDWWRAKIDGNRERDGRNRQALLDAGWRVGIVWECAMRATPRSMDAPAECAAWLDSTQSWIDIQGP